MSLEIYNTRAEWLAARGIGASAAPIILGLSSWGSPFSLWAEMTGLAPRDEDETSGKEWLEWGLRLEAPIAEAFGEKSRRYVTLRPRHSLVRHAEHPWLTASPDADQELDVDEQQAFADVGELPPLPLERAIYDTPGLLQIKTANAFKASEWKAGIPLYYAVQLQHEMLVSDAKWTTLALLIGGSRFKIFPDVARDDEFCKQLIPRLAAFQELVDTRTEPPLDDSEATAKALARMYPTDNRDTIVLPPEAINWDERLCEVKESIKILTSERTGLENRLKAAIGDASYGMLETGARYSWREQMRSEYTVPASTFKVLRRVK